MSQVNITQAAKLAGLSRSHFQKNYVKTGKITVSRDDRGRPQIDTAELLRVFGKLHHTEPHSVALSSTTQDHTPKSHTTHLTEIELLKQQLKRAEEREQFYQEQIKELTSTVKLLEAPKYPRLWWQFWK